MREVKHQCSLVSKSFKDEHKETLKKPIKNCKQVLFPYNLDDSTFSKVYVVNNNSLIHAEDVNEISRNIHTPQAKLSSIFQFPYNAKPLPLKDSDNETMHYEKHLDNGHKSNFKLYIQKVPIQPKIMKQRKLPVIKQAAFKTYNPTIDEAKNKLVQENNGSAKPMFGIPAKKRQTSNELRFRYDKSIRALFDHKNIKSNAPDNKKVMLSVEESINTSLIKDELLHSINEVPSHNLKVKKHRKKVSPIKQQKVIKEEPVIINPKPRPVFAGPDFYLVELI